MTEKNGTPPKPSIEELRAEIKQTRTELGETVQALAAKADVKARAKDQVEQTKLKVKAQAVGAAERVRGAAVAASDKVRAAVDHDGAPAAEGVAYPAETRTAPVPLPLLIAGVVALAGVILIVRGRRR